MIPLNDTVAKEPHNREMGFRLASIATTLLLVACAAPSASSPAASAPGTPPSPARSPDASTDAALIATATDGAGLTLRATFDRLAVEPGGSVSVRIAIENRRPTDVVFAEPCQPQSMTVGLQVPSDPVGREWTGLAAAFKTWALETSTGSPMESSVRTLQRTMAKPERCHAATGEELTAAGEPETIIPAGATYETGMTWSAEIVAGVPALPGPAPFSISVLHDLAAAGNGLIKAETLEAAGEITVLAGAPSAVSAGSALDATIADRAFSSWLAEQPRTSWVNANLYLQPGAIGVDEAVLPPVPYWAVELFREPRNWAIYYLDALTGKVLDRNFCNIPCDR